MVRPVFADPLACRFLEDPVFFFFAFALDLNFLLFDFRVIPDFAFLPDLDFLESSCRVPFLSEDPLFRFFPPLPLFWAARGLLSVTFTN